MDIDGRIEDETRRRIELAKELRLFDANAWIGRPSGLFPLAQELSPGELSETARKYFYSDALISHWDSVELSAQDGNRGLIDYSRHGSFPTIWTGLPLFPAEEGLLPGKGDPHPSLRGVRVFPRSHHFALTDWVMGSLCRWLVQHAMPLFVWHVEIEWEDLYRLAKTHPELRIVLESQWQKMFYHNRTLYNVMRECRNISVEISNLTTPDSLVYVCREFGAERVIFGSFLPVSDPWVPIGMILDSRVSPEEKALMAGGNLRRIIGG